MTNKILLGIAIVAIGFTSCGSPKRITLMRDMIPYRDYPVTQRNEIKIQEGDKLAITVDAKNSALAASFNAGKVSVSTDGSITQGTSQNKDKTYTVDKNGEINFPELGQIPVIGLTHKELEDFIKTKLAEQKILQSASVTVELLNSKIVVMRETDGQIVTIPDNKITILEAIARAGGVGDNTKMREVAVIREESGIRQMYHVDLNSVSLFDSPVYYLQQNDIVYLQPSSAGLPPRFSRIMQTGSFITGTIGFVAAIVALTK